MLTGRRVLVIEDEMLILMMIEDMLVDLGCESVTSAATIDQAIALIDAQVFDAAMLDMNLNGKNSRAVANALAARGVPFVFSTGNSVHDVWDGYNGHAILRKPFSNDDLVAMLTCLLSPNGVAISGIS